MNTIDTASAVRDFNQGHGTIFYQLISGQPAVLTNLHGSFGFCYLHQMHKPAKFRGVTATQAVEAAIKAGRDVIFTNNRPTLKVKDEIASWADEEPPTIEDEIVSSIDRWIDEVRS